MVGLPEDPGRIGLGEDGLSLEGLPHPPTHQSFRQVAVQHLELVQLRLALEGELLHRAFLGRGLQEGMGCLVFGQSFLKGDEGVF